MRSGPLRTCAMNGLIAGAAVALALAIVAAQHFKPGLLSLPSLILWHVVSLLIGGAAGFLGGLLAARLPSRAAAVSWVAGAAFGALAFVEQTYLFLLCMFRGITTWS